MKKKFFVIFLVSVLCIGLSTSVLARAQDEIPLKDTFYSIGSGFDGIYSYNGPGHPGGVFLTQQAYSDSISYYDLQFPWLNAISFELDGVYSSKTWTAYSTVYLGSGESLGPDSNWPFDNAVYLCYYCPLVSSPEWHVKLFFQDIPSYLLAGFEVQTLSQSGSSSADWNTGYVDSVPFTLSLVSEVPDEIYAFPLYQSNGTTVYMNEMFTQATYADNVYLLQFDSYNLDVIGFRLVFKNVTNLTYSDFATMSGSWFQQLGDAINSFPTVMGVMFRYFFTALPFLTTMAVIGGMYIFISSISKWSGG